MRNYREKPVEISSEDFRKIAHQLIDRISGFIENIGEGPVTSGESPKELQEILGSESLPQKARSPEAIISRATDLLLNHSLFNGHPKFFGYITSSATTIGALADLLAAAVNPNVGGQILSPVATEIEKQTVKWLVEFTGLQGSWGGILVSGGNVANLNAFFAAINAKAGENYREEGFGANERKLPVYAPVSTHTWIEKAVILSGLGMKSIRWVKTDGENKMIISELEEKVRKDREDGLPSGIIIGTAGDVSTGAVDNLQEISEVAKKYSCWFHVDGAYGAPAAVLPENKDLFKGLGEADSIAIDPHKWLYSPLEAGSTLVKNPVYLSNTYSSHPEYYNFSSRFEEDYLNYYEFGIQNSRGFRALKVWAALQQAGKEGYMKMIREDIRLAKLLFDLAGKHPELETFSHHLSITTFRFVPEDFTEFPNSEEFLNKLNEDLLNVLQEGGRLFLSNAIIKGSYCLRTCIVNYRTTEKDIYEVIDIIVEEGRKLVARK